MYIPDSLQFVNHSVAGPSHYDADLDPTFHFDTTPGPVPALCSSISSYTLLIQ